MADQNIAMPYDRESEEAIIGSILLDNSFVNRAGELLKSDDFYVLANKDIYEAMMDLTNQGQPIDLPILSDQLNKKGKLESIGGFQKILDISSGNFFTSNFEGYIRIVKEKSLLRKLIRASKKIEEEARSQKDPADLVLSNAEAIIYDISQNKIKEGLTRLDVSVKEAFKRMTEALTSDDTLTGLPTGFIDLDRKLSGFQKSDLILIAARPSVGKTALGLNIALNIALKNYKVAIFSMEMSKVQLAQRLLSMSSDVDLQDIISGNIQSSLVKLNNAGNVLNELDMYIDDSSALTLTEIRSKTRRLKGEKGLDFILIDYLQLMEGERAKENRQQEIASISRGLKGLAKELDIPILALSQLSRDSEKRSVKDKKPQMSDIRESGAIEQDCDVVMLMHRDDYYDQNTKRKNIVELNIAKHRNGPIGLVELFFKKNVTAFKNYGKRDSVDGV